MLHLGYEKVRLLEKFLNLGCVIIAFPILV